MSASEHNFEQDVLVSGEALKGFTADGSISQRKAVDINGDNQVTQVGTAGNPVFGVAVYDVADGEELPVAVDGCEVRVEVGGTGATAGEAAAADADGNFVDAGGDTSGDNVVGTFTEGGSDGDIVRMYIDTTVGVPQ
jgi:hypothetical protein